MKNQTVSTMKTVISYIENNLDGKLGLEQIADAVHYSKYHLHRLFTETVGMTIHDYALRRQLTEAAKLLVFSEKSVMEIALFCGYESQQAFTVAFKAMYKCPPAEYRKQKTFYPLQLQFSLKEAAITMKPMKSDIRFAEMTDIPAWMDLMRLVIDGYPNLDETDYLCAVEESIRTRQALILKDGAIAIGIMAFSYENGSIEFIGIHPQYRNKAIQKLFLDLLLEDLLPGREISITTYRAGDRADTGHRDNLKQLGFAEKELLVEYGYPTQRFVLPPKIQEETNNELHKE